MGSENAITDDLVQQVVLTMCKYKWGHSNVWGDATVKFTLWGHLNNQVVTVGFVSWGVNGLHNTPGGRERN